jgi:hypothetical protein
MLGTYWRSRLKYVIEFASGILEKEGVHFMPKKYGWNGWKMPFLHLNDPDFCEYGCPLCVPARKGNKIAKFIQKIENTITFGGCWWGRARKRTYGVNPDQPIPSKFRKKKAKL